MIAHIQGKVTELSPAFAVIDCGGVGYHINISLTTYSEINGKENVKLFTHLAIREDAHVLYGFSQKKEKELFLLLISVSGVGGSTALVMLSSMQPDEIKNAIISQNVGLLKSIKGIGNKSAERIIVDLKDKIGKINTGNENNFGALNNTTKEEALSALVMLGFARNSAEKAIAKVINADGTGLSVEELIKKTLKLL